MVRLLFLLVFPLLLAIGPAAAETAEVCEAIPSRDAPSGHAAGPCETVPIWRIDPQDRLIHTAIDLELPPWLWDSGEPIGLAVSAKASSQISINGAVFASNGVPAATRRQEIPGRMDRVFFVPRELIRPGKNEVRLLLSSHNGLLRLAAPFHGIAFVPYHQAEVPGEFELLALVAFGAFAAGAFYFGVRAVARNDGRSGSALLAGLCFFAGGQMAAEFARPLFGYPYPIHDVRLLAITACALGFGLCLFAYVALRLGVMKLRRGPAVLAGVTTLTILVLFTVRGFDDKAVAAVLVPSLGGTLMAAWAVLRRLEGASLFLATLAGFCALIAAAPYTFLDQTFYLAAATVLLFLFMQQARLLTAAENERAAEAARAAQLSAALDAAEARREETPQALSFSSGQGIDKVPLDEIASCRAAGDYVELRLIGGKEHLVSRRMADIEDAAPGVLLRVHRSFIVNLRHVRGLHRDPAGTGRLSLVDGSEVPVSRRIMPVVKDKLKPAPD